MRRVVGTLSLSVFCVIPFTATQHSYKAYWREKISHEQHTRRRDKKQERYNNSRHRSHKYCDHRQKNAERRDGVFCSSLPSRCEVSNSTMSNEAQKGDMSRQQSDVTPVAAELNAAESSNTYSRFLHRHCAQLNGPTCRYVRQCLSQKASNLEGEMHASCAPMASFNRLLKIHIAMRKNYESLRQNKRVMRSFSIACAEALLELGLPLRRADELQNESESHITVRVCDAPFAGEDTFSSFFLLLRTTPLYTTPISFPPPPLNALLQMTGLSRQGLEKGDGDFLLATLVSANGTDGASALTGHEAASGDLADEEDFAAAWGTITPGLESIFAFLQPVPVADIVQLIETLAYFKWLKDEELVEWGKGPVFEQLRTEVAALCAAAAEKNTTTTTTTTKTTTTSNSGLFSLSYETREMTKEAPHKCSDDFDKARRALGLTAGKLLDSIPRIDFLKTDATFSATPTNVFVHVIDVMLNVLMRVCLWQWPSMGFGDQAAVMLICSFPWFAHDLGIDAATWATYYHLRAVYSRNMSIDYYRASFFVQRLRRFCLPSVYDVDTAFICRLFMVNNVMTTTSTETSVTAEQRTERNLSSSSNTSSSSSSSRVVQKEHQEQVRNIQEQPTGGFSISFKDLVSVLYSTQEKQRVAYELLLVWLKQTHPADLHSSSPHGRHISATGIAIADVDHFVMRRFHTNITAGQWILFTVSDNGASALKRLTQGCQTPYALTRHFICNYHDVLPHIWKSINARRQGLLWAAWLRSVSRPLVDVVMSTGSTQMTEEEEKNKLNFLEPLAAIFASDVMFLRFITRLVIQSLREMAVVGNDEPLEELCMRLVEIVYTGGLVLSFTFVGVPENGSSLDISSSNLTVDLVTSNEKPLEPPQEKHQPAVIAIQRSFKEAIYSLVPRLGAEHVPVVCHLFKMLFESRVCGSGSDISLLYKIETGISHICDSHSQNFVSDWLHRRAVLGVTKKKTLEEPLLCRWQRLVEESDAGLPTRLPKMVEFYQSFLRLLKSRGYDLFDSHHYQQQGREEGEGRQKVRAVYNGEDETDIDTFQTPLFSSYELQVILTVLSRAIVFRNPALKPLRAMSLSYDVDSFIASTATEKCSEGSNKDELGKTGGGGRQDVHEAQALPPVASVTVVNDTATCLILRLERLLSMEVKLSAPKLPLTSLLEAIMLRLASFDILCALCRPVPNVQSLEFSEPNTVMLKMTEDFETSRHMRLVGNLVFFCSYSYAVPQDNGWMCDQTLTQQLGECETDAHYKKESGCCENSLSRHDEDKHLQAIAFLLLRTLVRAEMRGMRTEDTSKTATGGGGVSMASAEKDEDLARLDKVERVLVCHTLAAYIRLASLFSSVTWPFLVGDVYERFLDLVVGAVEGQIAGYCNNDSDAMFLWLAASATVAGIRFFSGAQKLVSLTPTTGNTTTPPEPTIDARSVLVKEKTMRVVCAFVRHAQSDIFRAANPRLKAVVNTIVAIQTFERLGMLIDTSVFNIDQLLLRASTDRRLLHRHLNLFLVGCSALPSTRNALLNAASFIREARNILSVAEISRAFVAISLSADTFAKHHKTQADLQQNSSLLDVTHSAAPTMRVPPTQLRHAWSALARRVLECAEEVQTGVFVRAIHCAGAVACVDTVVYRQLLSFVMQFRHTDLSFFYWTTILHTAQQSIENRRGLEDYLREPLTAFMLDMLKKDVEDSDSSNNQLPTSSAECLVEELCLFVETLPEMFLGDAEFWDLLRRVLGAQWSKHLRNNVAGGKQEEQATKWLQELTRSYEWAVRTAGHHDFGTIQIL